MKLAKYNPYQDLERSINRLWENGWSMPSLTDALAMDMYEDNGNFIAEVSLPNFKKDDVKVRADEGVLEISAEHSEEAEDKAKRRYFIRESSNRYFRRITLPDGVKTGKIEANFKNGMLKIKMPMAKPKEVKVIEVK